jgi:hypothetical protein
LEPVSFLPTGLGSIERHVEADILQANAAWWEWGKEGRNQLKKQADWSLAVQRQMMFLSGQYKKYFDKDGKPKN